MTPSFNQGKFIEQTIRSVLLQGYPNLEYFVMDGGSRDESVSILERYAPWITYWESTRDLGQSHAINKGFERFTGDIAAYLNSDDWYLPGAFEHVGACYGDVGFDVFVGRRAFDPPSRRWSRSYWRNALTPFIYPFIFEPNCRWELPQESIFWNRRRSPELRLDEGYQFCMDVWLFAHLYSGAKVVHTSKRLGCFRQHPDSKSSRLQVIAKKEIVDLTTALAAYSNPMSPDAKREILDEYRRASRLALAGLCKTFVYNMPRYLTER